MDLLQIASDMGINVESLLKDPAFQGLLSDPEIQNLINNPYAMLLNPEEIKMIIINKLHQYGPILEETREAIAPFLPPAVPLDSFTTADIPGADLDAVLLSDLEPLGNVIAPYIPNPSLDQNAAPGAGIEEIEPISAGLAGSSGWGLWAIGGIALLLLLWRKNEPS